MSEFGPLVNQEAEKNEIQLRGAEVADASVLDVRREIPRAIVHRLGGSVLEITAGSSSSGNPDRNSHYNWDETDDETEGDQV